MISAREAETPFLVLVRLNDGAGPLAYLDLTPIPLGHNGHGWGCGGLLADECFLCEARAGSPAAATRCPWADEVEQDKAALTAYADQYRVEGDTS